MKLAIGDKVKRTMGCRQTGVIVPRLALTECTDGTYRNALTARELREWVSVKWDDGSQGWINRRFLSKIEPTIEELYNELKPIRAEQILWHACQHIDLFVSGSFPLQDQGDLEAIELMNKIRESL